MIGAIAGDIIGSVYEQISHNHPEGVKGAQATVLSIYLGRAGLRVTFLSVGRTQTDQ